jgi:hypothetical protein
MKEHSDIRILINHGSPTQPEQWDHLAAENGNLQQSTCVDPVYQFYKETPVYIEIRNGQDDLLAGVKLYQYASSRMPAISARLSRRLSQFGEFLVKHGSVGSKEVIDQLAITVGEFIRSERMVAFACKGFYDKPEYLLDFKPEFLSKEKIFSNTYIDLTESEEVLWSAVHDHHKRKIQTALKNKLEIVQCDDFQAFASLMEETYRGQEHKNPNMEYVEHYYRVLKEKNFARLMFALHDNRKISAVMVSSFGKTADFTFGGSMKNNLGATHYLHWELIRRFRNEGYEKYFLGQAAVEDDPGNLKFSGGLSRFKRQFGPKEKRSYSKMFVFKKTQYTLWQMILKLTGKR